MSKEKKFLSNNSHKNVEKREPSRYLFSPNSMGVFWLLFHLIWKNYIIYWDFDSKSWIVDFFTRFTHEKTPQNTFSHQNFSVENNYCLPNTIQFKSNTNTSLFTTYFEVLFPRMIGEDHSRSHYFQTSLWFRLQLLQQ